MLEMGTVTPAIPGSLSPVKAQGRWPRVVSRGRWGSGHLPRGWDIELTSELFLGHPFRVSKALLGLWQAGFLLRGQVS